MFGDYFFFTVSEIHLAGSIEALDSKGILHMLKEELREQHIILIEIHFFGFIEALDSKGILRTLKRYYLSQIMC